MDRRSATTLLVAVAAAAALAFAYACGGSSPSSPSGGGSGTVGIQGVVLGSGSGSAPELTASAGSRSATGSITVTVEGTGITTMVSANGTFKFESVPGGTFTLVFTRDGLELGRISITASGGSEVKIVVQVQSTTLVVVNITIDDEAGTASGDNGTGGTGSSCPAISGGKVGQGIELEGNVSAVISTTPLKFDMLVNGERAGSLVAVDAGAASFKCNGGKPGSVDCKASLGAGDKVHVRGTLMKCDAPKPDVTAMEVKVQKG